MKRLLIAAVMMTAAACGYQEVAATSTTTTSPTPSSTTTSTLPGSTQADLINAAISLWRAAKPTSYEFTYNLACECDQGPWQVRVEGDDPVRATRLGPGPGDSIPYLSIEAIFNEIQVALAEGAVPVDVEYDDRYGFPQSYIWNGPELPVDGGFVLTVTEFVADPPKADAAQQDAFDQALARWSGGGFADYDYAFTRGCFCPEEFVGPYLASVRGGEVTAATFKGTDLFDIGMLEIGRYDEIIKTADGVFAEIERALLRADSFTAEYDPILGFPTNVYIDWIANAADEEVSYSISSLRDPSAYPESCSTDGWAADVVDQPGLPEPVAATRLTLFAAAMSCDFAQMAAVSDAADLPVQTSHGGSGPEYLWQSESRGVPAMRTIVEHLNLPYGVWGNELGTTYSWPSAMENLTSPQGDGLPADEYEALLELYPVEALEEMFEFFDGYVGYRIIIAADGQWLFALAGD